VRSVSLEGGRQHDFGSRFAEKMRSREIVRFELLFAYLSIIQFNRESIRGLRIRKFAARWLSQYRSQYIRLGG
jgi:hypothetical protein